jgi:twitching motility protein PilT
VQPCVRSRRHLGGEMRDLDDLDGATAAETGHPCSRRCTRRARPLTIDRVIDVPGRQQGQVRVQLADAQGIITQNLIPTADGRGRVAAIEILIPMMRCGTSSARRRSSRSTGQQTSTARGW